MGFPGLAPRAVNATVASASFLRNETEVTSTFMPDTFKLERLERYSMTPWRTASGVSMPRLQPEEQAAIATATNNQQSDRTIRLYFRGSFPLGRRPRPASRGDTLMNQARQRRDECRRVVQPGHHTVVIDAYRTGLRTVLDIDHRAQARSEEHTSEL